MGSQSGGEESDNGGKRVETPPEAPMHEDRGGSFAENINVEVGH
jgi:hypothetical protein